MKIFHLIIWACTQKNNMRQRLNMRLWGLNCIRYVVIRAFASTV